MESASLEVDTAGSHIPSLSAYILHTLHAEIPGPALAILYTAPQDKFKTQYSTGTRCRAQSNPVLFALTLNLFVDQRYHTHVTASNMPRFRSPFHIELNTCVKLPSLIPPPGPAVATRICCESGMGGGVGDVCDSSCFP